MKKLRQILFLLTAMFWLIATMMPLYGQAYTIADDRGVTVNLNGAQLIHRSPVRYSADAMAKGIVGSVTVRVTLDANGEVTDAAVLGGPGELGASAKESVASWHFDPRVAGTMRELTIIFNKPADSAVSSIGKSLDSLPVHTTTEVGVSDASPQPPAPQSGTIDQIDVTGLSDAAAAELLADFPVRPGDRLAADVLTKATNAVHQFDSHLTMEISRGMLAENVMKIRPNSIPAGPMLIKADRPVYPPLAKMAKQHGVIRLEAMIGIEGKVEELQFISGPPLLVQAAKDAVTKWVYQRTEMDGVPVKMATTILVNFYFAGDTNIDTYNTTNNGLAPRAK